MKHTHTPEQPSIWDYIGEANDTSLFDALDALVAIAKELLKREKGATVGEVVFEAEEHKGLKVGGVPMSDKILEQRQTSWLPRVMRVAGGKPSESTRRSPVKRHHKTRHVVWFPAEQRGAA